jgi:hypothetical protein
MLLCASDADNISLLNMANQIPHSWMPGSPKDLVGPLFVSLLAGDKSFCNMIPLPIQSMPEFFFSFAFFVLFQYLNRSFCWGTGYTNEMESLLSAQLSQVQIWTDSSCI